MDHGQEYQISLRMGVRYFPRISFAQAAEVVRRASRFDRETHQSFELTIQQDHWITGFWSDVLRKEDPPHDYDWIEAQQKLRSAELTLKRGNYNAALNYFIAAVESYNSTHLKLCNYLDGIRFGAQRAITLIEITETALVAAFMAPLELGAWANAGVAAAFKAGQGLLAQGFSGEFNWSDVGTDVAFEFASSLLAGGLANAFKYEVRALMTRRAILGPTGLAPAFLHEMVERMIVSGRLPAHVAAWKGKYIEHISQIAVMIVGSGIVVLVRKVHGRQVSVKDFVSFLLDDLGNDEMQIIGKALRLF